MRNWRSIVLSLFILALLSPMAALAAREKNFVNGDRVKVFLRGKYRICTVVSTEPGKVKIHFEDDETLYDRWVPIDIVENFTYKKGDIVLAKQEGKWVAARVIAAGTLKYKVNFVGMESKHDTWIGPDQIKDIWYKTGEMVMVHWNNDWFRAKILNYENGKYQVHYEGFPDSYDEWVTVDKIKK